MRPLTILVVTYLLSCVSIAVAAEPSTRPTLWIVGDSTVNNSGRGLMGWGTPIASKFDAAKINVQNKARGGRSSRTYITEGLWDQIVAQLRPGDFVIVQFGTNDGGPVNGPRKTNRASLRGNGEETEAATRPSGGDPEIVHTFGWYMRKYATDGKSKGATVILCPLIPHREWEADGTIQRSTNSYTKWTREAAEQSGASFVDLNDIIAKKYEQMGRERVFAEMFLQDHTHTTPAGAELNASCVVEGLRGLKDCKLLDYLLPGTTTAPATNPTALTAPQ